MQSSIGKRFVFAGCLLAALVIGLITWQGLRAPRPTAAPTPPSPNGYDDFLKASQLVASRALELTNLNPEILRPLVQQNQTAIELVRLGLTRECRVPLQFNTNYLSAHLTELGSLKSLARLLAAEGAVAEADGSLQDAVRSYLALIRFGEASRRGGFIADSLVAVAIQGMGVKKLHGLRDRLGLTECRDTIQTIASVERSLEPVTLTFQREYAYFRRLYGWWFATMPRLIMRLPWMKGQNAEVGPENTILRGQALLRLLIAELALHHYKLDNGSFPNRLAALVPKYLNAIPADPFTAGDFVYRLDESGYQLYSVGPDRRDDGGIPPGSRRQGLIPQGDVILD